MIGYIEGQIVERGAGYLVVDNHGMGYEMCVSNTTLSNLSGVNQARVYTYLSVREDGVTLFGFGTKEEKNMFLKLISVNDIGPKGAQTILSGTDLTTLITLIVTADIKALSKLKGIGKKTAERMVLELKEAIDIELSLLPVTTEEDQSVSGDKDAEDAVYALRGLGITNKEAVQAVKACRAEAKNLEDLIRLALKRI